MTARRTNPQTIEIIQVPMQEIERKYLVAGDGYRAMAERSVRISQGYLCTRRVTARIRLWGGEAYLTLKGRSRDGGLSRFEWERRIPVRCAVHLLARCSGVVEKVRHLVPWGEHTVEVDEFMGENEGLVMAEIELRSTDERPELPPWIVAEVTGDRRFYNAYLSKHPFRIWKR